MNLKLISKYRDVMFGLAIISIIIFHFTEDFYIAYKSKIIAKEFFQFWYMKTINSVGVEVFMFLSGMGLFYSLHKNRKMSTFYKNRMKRLLIPYIPVGIAYWVTVDLVLKDKGFARFIEDFSLISIFTRKEIVLWFVGAMVAIYILFPIIFKIVENERWQKSVEDGLTLIVIVLIGNFILNMANPSLFAKIEIVITRIPIFILGACFAKMIIQGVNMKKWVTVLIILTGLILRASALLIKYSQYSKRIISGVFALSLILLCCLVLELLKWNKFYRILSKIGEYSLELYMTHVTVRKVAKFMGYKLYDIRIYSIVILISIVCAVVLHALVGLVVRRKKMTFETINEGKDKEKPKPQLQ